MKIYLAGPMFTTAQRTWNEMLANSLRQSHEVRSAHSPDFFDFCLPSVDWCDILVVDLDTNDINTSVVFGYALARPRTRTIAYRTDVLNKCPTGDRADFFIQRSGAEHSGIGRDILGMIKRWEDE